MMKSFDSSANMLPELTILLKLLFVDICHSTLTEFNSNVTSGTKRVHNIIASDVGSPLATP